MLRIEAALVTAVIVVAFSVSPARAGEPTIEYEPPVDGAVVDPFRAPAGPYAPGNRGIEYAIAAGSSVRAAADGEVIFAGPVGGALHVTLLHADGLRTSYSFLAGVTVRRGQALRRGEVLGSTLERLHFGARDPDGNYLDPASLFGVRTVRVRLVPGSDEGRSPLVTESSLLMALVRDRPDLVGMARQLAADRLELVRHYRRELLPATRVARLGSVVQRWHDDRDRCTPADVPVPPPAGRRIAVLVAGLGSTSTAASIDDVDTDTLGYRPEDVVRFSYGGGRVPDEGDGPSMQTIGATSYRANDTQADLTESAERLRALVAAVAQANPGVPIDVLAHSQGGVVAGLALAGDGVSGPPEEVANLVTLGTPHEGADLATAALAAGFNPFNREHPARQVAEVLGYDPASPAIRQLSETSTISRSQPAGAVAPHIRVTSIAARSDLVVPSARSSIGGRPPIVVPVGGLDAHAELPGQAVATREIGLALAGRSPSCRGLGEVLTGAVVGESISYVTDAVGAGLLLSDLAVVT